jgi:cardiolipin synthase
MLIPTWLVVTLAGGTLLAFLLGLLLWSGRSQRYTRLNPDPLPDADRLLPAAEGLTQSWVVEGNSLELLENGAEFYPALLREIDAAERSVHLEVYAWWKGEICRRVTDALCAAAKRGAEVRLVVDALGSFLMEEELVAELEECGCRVARYHDFRLRTLGRLNKRDHRKLAILDGDRAFVFGHGIAKEWEGAGDRPECWRDMALRVTGPVVNHLQAVFAQHWMEETAEFLVDPLYFPDLETTGDIPLQVVASSPRGGVSNSSIFYRLMVGSARREILIQNPYFAPGPEMAQMLCDAAARGVRVRLMLPGPVTDSRIVQYAGRYLYERLLEAGVEIYFFQTTLNHQKMVVVDRHWCYVGSANFDERSFDINAEVGLGIVHEDFAHRLAGLFERDLKQAEQVELERWRRRPQWGRWIERAAFLVHDQL